MEAQLIDNTTPDPSNKTYDVLQEDLEKATSAYNSATEIRSAAQRDVIEAERALVNTNKTEQAARFKAYYLGERLSEAQKAVAVSASAASKAGKELRQVDEEVVKANEETTQQTLALLEARAGANKAQLAYQKALSDKEVVEAFLNAFQQDYEILKCDGTDADTESSVKYACSTMKGQQSQTKRLRVPEREKAVQDARVEKDEADKTLDNVQKAFDSASKNQKELTARLKVANAEFDKAQTAHDEAVKSSSQMESDLLSAKDALETAEKELAASKDRLVEAKDKLTEAEEQVVAKTQSLNEAKQAVIEMEKLMSLTLVNACTEAIRDCPSKDNCEALVANWTQTDIDWVTKTQQPNWRELASDCPEQPTSAGTKSHAALALLLLGAILIGY